MKIEIKHRFTGSVLFSHEQSENSVKITLAAAIESGADLRDANLFGADLRCADLRDADLRCADLRCADLFGADLRDANLFGADLRCADLRDANLFGEKLTKTPLFILNLLWDVTITTQHLRIGCQVHLISEWKSFDDEKIKSMASSASGFWSKYKTALIALCDAHAEGE